MSVWWPESNDEIYFVQEAFSLTGQIHTGYQRISTHEGFLFADNSFGPGYRHLRANSFDQAQFARGNEVEWISEERCFLYNFGSRDFYQEGPNCLRKAVCKVNLGSCKKTFNVDWKRVVLFI